MADSVDRRLQVKATKWVKSLKDPQAGRQILTHKRVEQAKNIEGSHSSKHLCEA
jgi:hypothetical protein